MTKPSVLAVGVCCVDQPNAFDSIADELSRSREWHVEQRWARVYRDALSPKFTLLNELLRSDWPQYDYVLACDDDIVLPAGFVDEYLEAVRRFDFALAQPARTHGSFIDHWFVEQLDGVDARRTRFVEIGPLFSVRRDAAARLLPFDAASPMGWGCDFVWPLLVERAGLSLGIVDRTPVAHTIRRSVAQYDRKEANAVMTSYLATRPHLSKSEAFVIVESYA